VEVQAGALGHWGMGMNVCWKLYYNVYGSCIYDSYLILNDNLSSDVNSRITIVSV
jgi:hypothetical protein